MKSLLSVQGVPGSPGSRGPPVSNVHVVEDSVVKRQSNLKDVF